MRLRRPDGPTVALALLDSIPPAYFVAQVLVVAARPDAWVCNWPAMVARGVVAACFLTGALLLLVGFVRWGTVSSLVAVVAGACMIGWIWSGSGFVVTEEILLWTVVGALVATMAAFRRRRDRKAGP